MPAAANRHKPVAETLPMRFAGHSYSVTVTAVPTGAFSKNLTAICPGKRMQPCDAAKGGT